MLQEVRRLVRMKPDYHVLSLCCGTGTTERALIRSIPSAHVTAIDLGSGQITMAKQKDRTGLVDYRVSDASDTGFGPRTFDRVLITLALHEMPRQLRMSILREAACVCRPNGRNDLQQIRLANEMKRAGLRVIGRHTTRPQWIEGIVVEPDPIGIDPDAP